MRHGDGRGVRGKLPAFAALAAALCVVSAGWFVTRRTEARLVEQSRGDVKLRLEPYSSTLSIAINRRVERTTALKAFVESALSAEKLDREFNVFASGVIRGASGVQSLQLLRHGVIDWVYPIEGNAALLHRDVLKTATKATLADVERTRRTGQVVLSPPRHVLQGIVAVIALQAIVSNVKNAPDLAAVVIELDSTFAVAGLLHGVPKLQVAVLDQEGNVILPWHGEKPVDPVSVSVVTPDGTWTLLGAPVGGWSVAVDAALSGLRSTWLIIAILVAGFVFVVVDRQSQLKSAVLARTRDLELANVELRREVQERERAEASLRSHEEQLLHSQKMEAMGTLAGGIAHDFNNLLTAIIGFGRLAEERATELQQDASAAGFDALRADIEQVLGAAEHASIVTNQLLSFSRKQVVNPVALDVGDVTISLEVLLRRLLGERVRLTIRISQRPAVVFTDRGQLVQVLMNLAVNARDAMPEGGDLTLDVNRRVVAAESNQATMIPPGRYVEISVADSGVGMAPDVASRAFEPFYTTKGLGKGTGLGLSTVYGIVQRAGGHVHVESEPGRGSHFRVLLPEQEVVVPVADDTGGQIAEAVEATILVAEDEPSVRSIVTRVLRGRGYLVLEAESGEQAIALSAATPGRIDLLLTDLVMTGMSGLALSEHLRRSRSELKVIFMSGYSDEAQNLGTLDEVHAAFLAKPFTPEQLATRVSSLLEAGAVPA